MFESTSHTKKHTICFSRTHTNKDSICVQKHTSSKALHIPRSISYQQGHIKVHKLVQKAECVTISYIDSSNANTSIRPIGGPLGAEFQLHGHELYTCGGGGGAPFLAP